MPRVLLNIDTGELESETERLYRAAHLVHIACGGHVGDDRTMARAVHLAERTGAIVGAHPSYPDREGFGRRSIAIDVVTLAEAIAAQCRSLREVAANAGATVASLKPHGALYHDADRNPELAAVVAHAARDTLGPSVWLVGPRGGALEKAATELGLRFLREKFADRGVGPDGSLIPRSEPGALIADPSLAAARAEQLAHESDVDTICVHGDTPSAESIAETVRKTLDRIERSASAREGHA